MSKNAYKNEAHVSGELKDDPQIKYTPSGKPVANLTLVTKYEKYSEYHRIVLWEALAEKVAPLVKGDFLKVVGRLQTRSWVEKTTGQKKYMTEIVGFQASIPAEEPEPLTPDQVTGRDSRQGGIAIARAILKPPPKDEEIPF